MKIGSARVRVEWGHLALVAGLAAFCLWYWHDARAASSDFENLLLIQPAAIVALALCALLALGTVKRESSAAPSPAAAAAPGASRWRGPVVAVLLCLYVVAVIPVGFDVATFGFLLGGMYALGERRPVFLLAYAGALACGLSYGFKVMLSVPVPTLIF